MAWFDPESWWKGATTNPFVIGAAGALVSLRWAPGSTVRIRLWNVLCGTLLAGFGTGALFEGLSLNSPAMFGGLSFLLGAIGMNLMDAIVEGVKATPFGQIITGWLSRRGGSGGPPQ